MKAKTSKLDSAAVLVVLYFITAICLGFMLTSCGSAKYATHHVDRCPSWANCINNPENKEFVDEVAFNLNIKPQQVTQEQFDKRYN